MRLVCLCWCKLSGQLMTTKHSSPKVTNKNHHAKVNVEFDQNKTSLYIVWKVKGMSGHGQLIWTLTVCLYGQHLCIQPPSARCNSLWYNMSENQFWLLSSQNWAVKWHHKLGWHDIRIALPGQAISFSWCMSKSLALQIAFGELSSLGIANRCVLNTCWLSAKLLWPWFVLLLCYNRSAWGAGILCAATGNYRVSI